VYCFFVEEERDRLNTKMYNSYFPCFRYDVLVAFLEASRPATANAKSKLCV